MKKKKKCVSKLDARLDHFIYNNLFIQTVLTSPEFGFHMLSKIWMFWKVKCLNTKLVRLWDNYCIFDDFVAVVAGESHRVQHVPVLLEDRLPLPGPGHGTGQPTKLSLRS